MAMTKKEQAAFDALKQQNEFLRALAKLPSKVPQKDVPAPEDRNTYTSGFDYNLGRLSSYGVRDAVFPVWSETSRHGEGTKPPTVRGGGSRDGVALFSTRALALEALRIEYLTQCAKTLAALDAEIAGAVEQ